MRSKPRKSPESTGFISYIRVSTKQQGQSGLGLEAQQVAINTFLANVNGQLVGEYKEVESGKNNDRPRLKAAIAHCRMTGGTLLIAKLDRLSRDAHFLLGLEKAGVDFIATDMPSANRMTVGVMALVADEERRMISARTKAALAAARTRGTKLGGWSPVKKDGSARAKPDPTKPLKAAINKADRFALQHGPYAQSLRDQDQSYRQIAEALCAAELATPNETAWTPTAVRNLVTRYAKLRSEQPAIGK